MPVQVVLGNDRDNISSGTFYLYHSTQVCNKSGLSQAKGLGPHLRNRAVSSSLCDTESDPMSMTDTVLELYYALVSRGHEKMHFLNQLVLRL